MITTTHYAKGYSLDHYLEFLGLRPEQGEKDYKQPGENLAWLLNWVNDETSSKMDQVGVRWLWNPTRHYWNMFPVDGQVKQRPARILVLGSPVTFTFNCGEESFTREVNHETLVTIPEEFFRFFKVDAEGHGKSLVLMFTQSQLIP